MKKTKADLEKELKAAKAKIKRLEKVLGKTVTKEKPFVARDGSVWGSLQEAHSSGANGNW